MSGRFVGRVRALPASALASGLPLLTWQVVFLLVPTILLVVMTFWTVENFQIVANYNIQNWIEVLTSAVFVDVLVRTLVLATIAGAVSFALAFPFAYGIAFKLSPGMRRLAIALLIAPFFTSYLLRIYSWNFMLADRGVLNYILEQLGLGHQSLPGTWTAIILGYLTNFFPLIVLILVLTLMNLDQRLVEAANNLGAGRWRSVFSVVFPSIKVGITIAVSFAFILAFGDPVAPQVLGIGRHPTLAQLITAEKAGGVDFPSAAVVAVVMVIIMLVLIFATTWFAFPARREPERVDSDGQSGNRPRASEPMLIEGTGVPAAEENAQQQVLPSVDRHRRSIRRHTTRDPARVARQERLMDRSSTVLFKSYIGICFFFIYMPIVSLVVFSFADNRFPTLPWPGFTTEWYTTLNTDPEIFPSFKNSVVIALLVGLVATVLGAACAYFLNRWEFRGKNLYLGIVIIGPCIPLVILALSLFIFLRELHIVGSLTAVVVSHIGLAAAFSIALVRMRLLEMDMSLEKAAWNLGANEWRTIWKVVIPQALPALIAAFFLTMAVSWNEFIIAWFVSGLESTLPVKIFNFFQGNISPRINAVGSIVVGMSFVLVTVAMLFTFVIGKWSRVSRVAEPRA